MSSDKKTLTRSHTSSLDKEAKESLLGSGVPSVRPRVTKPSIYQEQPIADNASPSRRGDPFKKSSAIPRSPIVNPTLPFIEEFEEFSEDNEVTDPEEEKPAVAPLINLTESPRTSRQSQGQILSTRTFPVPSNWANMANSQIKIRDAISMVPIFSGGREGTTFREFAAACMDAKGLIPADAEEPLTHLLKTRLRNGALEIIRGSQPTTIVGFLKILRKIYAPLDSTVELYGELARLCQKTQEDVAGYFNRATVLGHRIIEAHKSENEDAITPEKRTEIENACCRAFVLGLKREIYSLMTERTDLNEAGPEAIKIEGLILMQKNLRNV